MASQLEQWVVEEPYVNPHCKLGEGPFYEAETNSVRFVDIIQKRIHSVSLTDGPDSLTTVELDTPITVTCDIEGVDPREKILIGAKYGIAVLDRKTEKYEYINKMTDEPNQRIRTNDGAADPLGKFWIGTMTDFGQGDFRAEGSLFRFDAESGKEEILKDLMIPNSVGWSPDNKILYFTHSTAQQVLAFDYNQEDGSVSNKRVFYQHEGTGDPDGFRVDSEGNLWHAVYGEARVLKISTEGKLVGEVKIPTKNATCTQFVGTELFITTAGDPEGEGGEKSKEYGGALFRVDVGVTGLDLFKFKLGKS